jgi:hypothetical protein
MKRSILKLALLGLLLTGCLAITLSGCKKEFYNFPNGYDNQNGKPSNYFSDSINFTVDKSYYPQARIFPGLVSATQRRIPDTTVNFNFNYTYVPATTLGVSYVPSPVFSTGLFDPAGELIEIDVPQGVTGLTVRVGSQTDNLTGLTGTERDPQVSTVEALFPGINTVRNLYGGYIWILTTNPISSPVKLVFKRAVASSDFILGVTTNVTAWEQQVTSSGVPWLELRSAHTAFSVPRDLVIQGIQSGYFSNIDKTMAQWDNIITQDYYQWFGLIPGSSNLQYRSPELQERFVMDVQLSNNVAIHNGQPIMAVESAYWLGEWANYTSVAGGNSLGTFQELTLNYTSTSVNFWWSTIAPSIVYLSDFKTAARTGSSLPLLSGLGTGLGLDQVIPQALAYANSGTGKLMDVDANAVGVSFRLVPLLQLLARVHNPSTNQDGYAFMTYLYNRAKAATVIATDDMSRKDFFYSALCDYTQTDFSRFFDAWGMPLSTVTRSAEQAKYPQLQDPIWLYNPLTQQYVADNDPTRLKRVYTPRANWVYTASTTSTTDGALSSLAGLFDGDPTTWWSSCLSGCSPLASPVPPPHTINIDMQQTTTISGFYLSERENSTTRQPTSMNVYYSNDGTNYTSLGTYTLLRQTDQQEYSFPKAVSCRYVRFVMTQNTYDNVAESAMAELGTFNDN